MKKFLAYSILFILVLCLCFFVSCSDSKAEENIATVQNGYLGEYTDITIKALFSKYYGQSYDEETWEGGSTDEGKDLVQVCFHDSEDIHDDVTIQFTMLDGQCFELSAFVDPAHPLDAPADLMVVINSIYIEQYSASHPDLFEDAKARATFADRMEGISGSAVLYGASADYEGNRGKLCELVGDTPIALSVAKVVMTSDKTEYKDLLISKSIETVQNGYLGEYTDIPVRNLLWGHYSMCSYDEETWEGGTTEDGKEIVQVTYHDDEEILEDANIQFTMLNDEVFKVTAFVDPLRSIEKSSDLLAEVNYIYFEQYIAEHQEVSEDFEKELALVKRLEGISGSAVQYGASAEYSDDRSQLCTLNGDLPLDVNVAMLLDSAGRLDMDYYYATPSPVPTQEPTPTPEPPAANDLAQYYGFYNSKDLGLFWVTLDKGSDDDSFYVYIEYEPMLNKNDVHANIKPDGETYMTFYADNMTGSDGIIKDMNSIEGAVSLEILDDGSLHMVLYTSQRKEDTPFDVILEPEQR